MKQFIVNLFLFQWITGRYSPVMSKVKNRELRVAILVAIFAALCGYQVYDYTQSK